VPVLKRFRDFGHSTLVYHHLLVTTLKCVIKCVTRRTLVRTRSHRHADSSHRSRARSQAYALHHAVCSAGKR
jgi:hypothetical protein